MKEVNADDNVIVSDIPAIEGVLKNVRLEQKNVIKKKNGKCSVYCQILGRSDKKEELINRILNERFDSTRKNKFGINIAPPDTYNIDDTLWNIIRMVKDRDTNLPVIHSFDITKDGFYCIYLNDTDNEKKQRMLQLNPDKDIKHRQTCTKWYPADPLQILKLEQADMTLKNFKKLADWKNYFLWEGYVYPTPEAFKRRQREADQRRIEREQAAIDGPEQDEEDLH